MSNGAGKFSPFPKMSFRTSLHDKVLPKTVCFVTVHWCQSWGLNSDREAQSAWCPNPVIGGPVPPGSAAYVTLSVQHPRTLRAHVLKFHVATKHEQPLLGFHASRGLELLSVVEENITRGPGGTC